MTAFSPVRTITRPVLKYDEEFAWTLAKSIQVTPDDKSCGKSRAVITARPHATGWFISARLRANLSRVETEQFKAAVALSVFELLTRVPPNNAWSAALDNGGWVAHIAHDPSALDAVEPVSWNRDDRVSA
jgi:hypothetical protein